MLTLANCICLFPLRAFAQETTDRHLVIAKETRYIVWWSPRPDQTASPTFCTTREQAEAVAKYIRNVRGQDHQPRFFNISVQPESFVDETKIPKLIRAWVYGYEGPIAPPAEPDTRDLTEQAIDDDPHKPTPHWSLPPTPTKPDLDRKPREEAARALRELYPEQHIFTFVGTFSFHHNIAKALQSKDSNIRQREIEDIGRIGREEAARALGELYPPHHIFDYTDEVARMLRELNPAHHIFDYNNDIETLPRLGARAKGAVPMLTEALQSKDSDIRQRAIKVIGLIGRAANDSNTIRLLRLALDESQPGQALNATPVSRQAAKSILQTSGTWDTKSLDILIKALEDETRETRIWAAGALRGYGEQAYAVRANAVGARAEQSLLKALRTADKEDKVVFAFALSKLVPDATQRILDVNQVLADFKKETQRILDVNQVLADFKKELRDKAEKIDKVPQPRVDVKFDLAPSLHFDVALRRYVEVEESTCNLLSGTPISEVDP